MSKIASRGIIYDSAELRRLIAENPDLPIVVLAGEDANTGDYGWQYCMKVSCCIDEILDCETPFKSDYVYSDHDDFEEDLVIYLANIYGEKLTDEEYEKLFRKEISKYKSCWKKVIAIYVDN